MSNEELLITFIKLVEHANDRKITETIINTAKRLQEVEHD